MCPLIFLLVSQYKILTKNVLQDIFKPTHALLIICPFLLELYLALADDHHEELVNGLLGDLAFQVMYFSHDTGLMDNSPYRKESNLRQKKIYELLREGGFNTLGFQLRSVLKPHIIEHSNYKLPSARVYEEIVISRPSHVGKFAQLIATSTFVQHLPDITSWFKSVQKTANGVTKPIANAYLGHEVDNFKWQKEEEIKEEVLSNY